MASEDERPMASDDERAMPSEDERPMAGEDDVRVRILRLDATAQAISTGVLAGVGIFVATNWLVLKGGPVVGPNLALLAQFCPGYSVTFIGSLIGLGYGLVYGGAAGFAVSWIYNRFVQTRRS